ncbi:hypothetical protein BDV95DRAFT_595609 [Massariosphaeria phaeospora]|uniref:Gfd2/YDR514C-like C-terminal domain-containing protein n=1 Tax=Massariosphaeria phaeospora TaxID=100035 RepID=A0A7C8M6M2_9PLEO|nr:hypothetical protein BDV95DRAFT_595609 [Massariosphaeria phaeospora]
MSPMEELRRFLATQSQTEILRLALGVPNPDAPELAKHLIVNTIDCESFVHDHTRVTEVGLVSFSGNDTRPLISRPTAHAENILQQCYFYHFRILANAHCVNRTFCKGEPENNHFGHTRFVTESQLKDVLDDAFGWPIDPAKPELGFCPVVFLGHAISNDLSMLNRAVGFNSSSLGTVVATIDTQDIANENGIRGAGDNIGLTSLAARFGFATRDAHTAGNDTAYTLIAAVQMALQDKLPEGVKSMQKVIHDLADYSQMSSSSDFGIANFCTRCGQYGDHRRPECRERVRCAKCATAGRGKAIRTHTTAMCSR